MQDREAVIDNFEQAVNMSAGELERWLRGEAAREVGWTHEGEHESVGHHSGRRIVALLRKRKTDYGDEDLAHCARWSATCIATSPSARTATCARRAGAGR